MDTSGRHKQEASLFEEMQQIDAAVQPGLPVHCDTRRALGERGAVC